MVWSHACERPFPSRKKQKEQKTKRELHFSPCDLVVLINVSKLREVWPSVLLDGSTKTDNPIPLCQTFHNPLVVQELCPQLVKPQDLVFKLLLVQIFFLETQIYVLW